MLICGVLLFLFVLIIIPQISTAANIYVDDDADPGWYDATHVRTVQEGNNNASATDTVYVWAGTYVEAVTISKSLTIIGNGTGTTILSAGGGGNKGFELTADRINISHININYAYHGIYSESHTNINISNCLFTNISRDAMDFVLSTHCNFYNNFMDGDELNTNAGIRAERCNNFTVYNNTFFECDIAVSFATFTSNGDSYYNVDMLVYNNIFTDNRISAWDKQPEYKNKWNVTKVLGTNIIGGPYLGGNNWSDYIGIDLDDDGIGDENIPYKDDITYGGDYLPLTSYAPPSGGPPVFSNPDPANESTDISIALSTWNITINDVEGDAFNYTIECSNGDTVSDTEVTNNTFTLNLVSGFAYGTTYTVWVNATDQLGSDAWTNETFWFQTEDKTVIDSFLIKTEHGANSGWDLDNDNVTLDITFHDVEGDTTYLYFTFNKGSQARLPSTGDYDATFDGGVNATITDYDLTWTAAGSWVDYDGVIYVRVVGWNGADYTTDITYSTLAKGIDGTTPSSNVDDIPGYNRSYSPLDITATATDSPSAAMIDNVTLYYSFSTDNISWSSWTLFQTDYSSPYSYEFTFPDGAGWYRLGTRALDLAGNLEAQVTDDTIFFTAAFEHESGVDLVERGLGVGVGDLILFVLTCSFIIVAAVDVRISVMFATLLYSVLFIIYYEATAAGFTDYDPVRAGICVAISIVILALLILSAGKSKSRMGYIP